MKNLVIMFALFFSIPLLSCEEDPNYARPRGYIPNLTFDSFFPEQVQVGGEIILSANNFNTEILNTSVRIGEAIADIVAINESTIIVKAPYYLPPGWYKITVSSNGQVVLMRKVYLYPIIDYDYN